MPNHETSPAFEGLVETADATKVDLQALVDAQAEIAELLASNVALDETLDATVRGLEHVLSRAKVALHMTVEGSERAVTTAPNLGEDAAAALASVSLDALHDLVDPTDAYAPVTLSKSQAAAVSPTFSTFFAQNGWSSAHLTLVTPVSDPTPSWLVVFMSGRDDATKNERALIRNFAHFVRMAIDQHRRELQLQGLIADERQRIAGVIHDDPIQALTAVSLRIQRLARYVEGDAADQVAQLQASVGAAIERMRRLLIDLHPPSLDDEGIVSAIDAYLGEVLEPLGIRCTLRESVDSDLSLGTASLAYRLAVEALWNVVKHAEATTVDVVVTVASGSVSIDITDDGAGFDTSSAARRRAGHMGISACRELASRASGTWSVDSDAGRGTTVRLWLPGPSPVDATNPGPPNG